MSRKLALDLDGLEVVTIQPAKAEPADLEIFSLGHGMTEVDASVGCPCSCSASCCLGCCCW